MKICPFCNSKMSGIIGKRICSNVRCGGYEVDMDNRNSYDKKLSKQDRQERLNVNS